MTSKKFYGGFKSGDCESDKELGQNLEMKLCNLSLILKQVSHDLVLKYVFVSGFIPHYS